ncbi:hypothetical protein [Vulgatibacter sp.]|uniref:hypothetical protein n=1 Tax=Vulgatibacter sp. TaxID=1971226 RepID=UPI003564002B
MIRLLLVLFALAGCSQLQSPDTRAREAVAAAAAEGFSLPLDGATLDVPPGRLTAISVTTAPLGEGKLRGFARISLEGRLDGMPVSYVGDERFVVACAGRCALEGPPAPRLVALLEVLLQRRAALEAGDRERLASLAVPDARQQIARADLQAAAARPVAGWFIRIDRDEAMVGEAAPGAGQRQLILRHEQGSWRLVSGLP